MSEYKDIYILRLLHVIHNHLSVDELINLGLEYSQVAEILSSAIKKELVQDSGEEGLTLTVEGLKVLADLNKRIYPNNSKEWILPSEKNRIPKIDRLDIYLPKNKMKHGE